MSTLHSLRLVLRPWRDEDLAPFAALNGDPETMQYMARRLNREESDALGRRMQAEIAARGWGWWALERCAGGEFLGCVGLAVPAFEARFTPCVEVGWRLARAHWGQGYATEAARECLRFAFESLTLPEVVSFTACVNARSQAVMRRLGMRADGEFEHPRLSEGHPLRRHLLYRLGRADWAAQSA